MTIELELGCLLLRIGDGFKNNEGVREAARRRSGLKMQGNGSGRSLWGAQFEPCLPPQQGRIWALGGEGSPASIGLSGLFFRTFSLPALSNTERSCSVYLSWRQVRGPSCVIPPFQAQSRDFSAFLRHTLSGFLSSPRSASVSARLPRVDFPRVELWIRDA